MRRNIALALTGLFVGFGLWLGEGPLPPWAELTIAAGAIGCLAVALTIPGKPWFKALGGVASLTLFGVAFFVGSLSFGRAFNECVEKGEEVRVQLREYFEKKNQYPERLSQLEGFGLCGRIIRPTVFEYKKTNDGYILSFRDWLVEHTATEAEPFMAYK